MKKAFLSSDAIEAIGYWSTIIGMAGVLLLPHMLGKTISGFHIGFQFGLAVFLMKFIPLALNLFSDGFPQTKEHGSNEGEMNFRPFSYAFFFGELPVLVLGAYSGYRIFS